MVADQFWKGKEVAIAKYVMAWEKTSWNPNFGCKGKLESNIFHGIYAIQLCADIILESFDEA